MKRVIRYGLVVLALVISAQAIAAEKLHIEGSTTVGPIADGFAEVFKDMYPDIVITVNKAAYRSGCTYRQPM
jgi:ABC-type phosphate transport system substrate-binding protein